MDVLEPIYVILSLIGVVLVSLPRIEGFYFFILGQLLAIIYFYNGNQNWLLFQMVFLIVVNMYAIWSWGKKGVGNKPLLRRI